MWLQLLLLLVGFTALVWSADKFLSGAASTAVNFSIPKIVIGITIVAPARRRQRSLSQSSPPRR